MPGGHCVYVYRDEQKRPYYVGSGTLKRPYVTHGNLPLPPSLSQIRVKVVSGRAEARRLEELLLDKWRIESEGGLLKNRWRRGVVPSAYRGRARPSVRPPEHRAGYGQALQNPYCVYIYRDENKIPYYVGCGKRQRPFDKGSRSCPMPLDVQQIRVKYCQSKGEALALEALLIRKWGRRVDGGLLCNKSLGGLGVIGLRTFGRKASPRARQRMSAAKKGWRPSAEMRALASRVHTGRVKSAEERANISAAIKASPAARAQLAELHRKRRRPVYWLSPIGTLVRATQVDLIAAFPLQGLQQSGLSRVMNGVQSSHRGWRLAGSIPSRAGAGGQCVSTSTTSTEPPSTWG